MPNQKIKLTPQQQIIRELSDRLVEAQRPIRILNALKWNAEIQHNFFKHKFTELPDVNAEYYQRIPLQFDPEQKIAEFYQVERDVKRHLGQYSPIGHIMLRMCREYREVVRMLCARGTPEFSEISQELYGSSEDAFYLGAPTLRDLAKAISETLTKIDDKFDPAEDRHFTSEQAVEILQARLSEYFNDPEQPVVVKLSDDIVADASAGAESIKIRKDAKFSERDLKILEVHEGWVHIGTTFNGLAQPVCTFLSKGPPSSTINQEGLGIIMEIFTFSSYPHRVKRLTDRVTAIHMAEEGADFLDVFNFYREQHYGDEQSYVSATRIFRGSTPILGPFTKDLSYSRGFILIYNYIRLAIKNGLKSYIPLLFLGKTSLEDLHVYEDLMEDGTIVPPKYLPPQFRDLSALCAWMAYSLFLNQLSLEHLKADYKGILQT